MKGKVININEYNKRLYEDRDVVSLGSITAYDHLYNMCKHVRNSSNSGSGYMNPITPRLEYIMQSLASMGISFELDIFEAHNGKLEHSSNKLANVVVHFESEINNIDTTIFSAHHDIANPKSENCQDNTASVCNLLELCSLLYNTPKENLKENVIIVFTDCEEVGGRGMTRLVENIKKYEEQSVMIYSLELSANGRNYWIEGVDEDNEMFTTLQNSMLEGELNVVGTPYNESMNARRAGLEACCIGILSDTDMEEVKNRGYCGAWGLCHSFEDTFERSANMEDMKHFNETLLRIVTK
jgi:acetylornithine deacetylase/succinyl-diaminopimelate desuccinylase-like protein